MHPMQAKRGIPWQFTDGTRLWNPWKAISWVRSWAASARGHAGGPPRVAAEARRRPPAAPLPASRAVNLLRPLTLLLGGAAQPDLDPLHALPPRPVRRPQTYNWHLQPDPGTADYYAEQGIEHVPMQWGSEWHMA